MHPLYPLLSPQIFDSAHLHPLTSSEALLLAAMVTIASRYYTGLPPGRREIIHGACARWAREEISFVMDGTSDLRHVSTVEALLLFAEWPPIPVPHRSRAADQSAADPQAMHNILRPSKQYDSLSWIYIGTAVRLAQELSLDEKALSTIHEKDEPVAAASTWENDRLLRTWLNCYNADRHISARLGRNAVIQDLPTQFWERVTGRASSSIAAKGAAGNPWTEAALPQGMIAVMMGTIADRLYPSKEVTRAIIRTGQWEGFLRSLSLERQFIHLTASNILGQAGVESALLQIEMDYVQLYGNAVALRSWQERKKRRFKANDFALDAPLFSLAEGTYILEAMSAAQSILRISVSLLEPHGYLRLSPCRIFQRVLFAATFLLKGLATGAIEHEQATVMSLLSSTITALESASIDAEHISYGFAALLRQLHLHTQIELAPVTVQSASDAALAAADAMTVEHLRSLAPQSWEGGGDDYSPFQSLTIDGGLKFPWDAWDGFEDFPVTAQEVPGMGFDA
ncbi:hypothetical protein RQP46_005625 [Phenoliferia psychrophenolica]